MAWNKTSKYTVGGMAIVLVIAAAVFIFLRWSDPKKRAIAHGEAAIADHIAEPLDLTSFYQTPASYFVKITQFPAWGTIPTGFQVFDNVPLQIDGMTCLYGEGNAKMGINFPESATNIVINRKFETLYLYHGCFFQSPEGTPVYDIVFRYADGTSETRQILYGSDIVDWVIRGRTVDGPTGTRSKLAWNSKPPLPPKTPAVRFSLTAIENPYPSEEVASIDLYSCKSRTAPCILAITTGRSGMMKKN
ncbi:MAG TPA: hypothetical protein VH255_09885 [Verrucomicrobiae bacterium]|nr:hypothetical protein [Verrucomicrobiae bacterium]